jgi:hypothetical protein
VGQLSITSAFLVPTEICPYCFCFEIFLLVCKSAVCPPSYCICCLIQFPPASRCRLPAGPGIQGTGKHKKKHSANILYFPLLCVHIVFQFNLHYTTTQANYATGKNKKRWSCSCFTMLVAHITIPFYLRTLYSKTGLFMLHNTYDRTVGYSSRLFHSLHFTFFTVSTLLP